MLILPLLLVPSGSSPLFLQIMFLPLPFTSHTLLKAAQIALKKQACLQFPHWAVSPSVLSSPSVLAAFIPGMEQLLPCPRAPEQCLQPP